MELETFFCLPLVEPFILFVALPPLLVQMLILFLHLWIGGSIRANVERRFKIAEKWDGKRGGGIPASKPHLSIERVNAAGRCCGCRYQSLNLGKGNHSIKLAGRLIESAWDGTKVSKFGACCKR